MRRSRQVVAFAALSLALVGNSTSAAAQSQAPPSSSWMALSMLTPSGAIAMCGAAAASAVQPTAGCVLPQADAVPATQPAAQQAAPPPPPPPEYAGFASPPLPVIAVWLAVILADIYILTRDHHHEPNSPA